MNASRRRREWTPVGSKRSQQRHRCDGRHFVAAQNIFFSFLHGAHAGAKKAAADNAEDEHHRDDKQRVVLPCFALKNPAEKEKENEREEVIEKQDRAIPARQLKSIASRARNAFISLAQFLAGHFDEDVFRVSVVSNAHLPTSKPLRIDPLHDLDQRARRLFRTTDFDTGAVIASVGAVGLWPLGQLPRQGIERAIERECRFTVVPRSSILQITAVNQSAMIRRQSSMNRDAITQGSASSI